MNGSTKRRPVLSLSVVSLHTLSHEQIAAAYRPQTSNHHVELVVAHSHDCFSQPSACASRGLVVTQ